MPTGYSFKKNEVFIGMQFKDMDDIYEVLKKSCEENGLNATRVDELVNAGSIIDDIEKLIEEAIALNKPFLGICLGMQHLFDSSEEGKLKGLQILNNGFYFFGKFNFNGK